MSKRQMYHVKLFLDGGWQVKSGKESKPLSLYQTKAEALVRTKISIENDTKM